MSIFRAAAKIGFVLVAMAAFGAPAARADAIEDFYKGKTVTVIIGAGAGGLYDEQARLIARHMPKYLPGNPNFVPQNMPGASQLLATEFSYNVAPKDGTSLLVVQAATIVSKLLDPKLKFETNEFNWIGRVTSTNSVGLLWHTAPIKNAKEAKEKEAIMGANAPSGRAAMIPNALNRLAGTKFKIVLGYRGERDEALAMERGEIHGVGNYSIGDMFTGPAYVTNKLVNVMYIVGLERIAQLPDVPAVVELIPNPADREVMNLIAGTSNVGVTIMAPPKVPAERVEALRTAFMKMMKDPAYIAELKKTGYDPEPMNGADLQKFVKDKFSASPELVARMKAVTEMK
jgi:tripartite-type tricarboxylate transporter receptor subunit TctC